MLASLAAVIPGVACHMILPYEERPTGLPDAKPPDAAQVRDIAVDAPAREAAPGPDLTPQPDLSPGPDLSPQPDLPPQGQVTTIAGDKGSSSCTGGAPGTKGSASKWKFKGPRDVVAWNSKLYVADELCHQVLEVDPGAKQVKVYAGTGSPGATGGYLAQAQLNGPTGLAFDGAGKLYIADRLNNMIRVVSAGKVYAFAGSKTAGKLNGTGTAARFNRPLALAIWGNTLHVADAFNYQIRVVDLKSKAVTTLAGSGSFGSKDGPAAAAEFGHLGGIAVNSAGAVYVTDGTSNVIRRVQGGQVKTIMVGPFDTPAGLAFDAGGALYVADRNHFKIKLVTGGTVTLVAGTGLKGTLDGPRLTTARFMRPVGLALDKPNPTAVFVADYQGPTIRKVELK